MDNKRAWLPPMDLWKYRSQRLPLGIPLGPNEEVPEMPAPGEYGDLFRSNVQNLVAEAWEQHPQATLDLLESYFPGISQMVDRLSPPEDVAANVLDWDNPPLAVGQNELGELLAAEISLQEYKSDLGLEKETPDDLSQEAAQAEVWEVDLPSLLSWMA